MNMQTTECTATLSVRTLKIEAGGDPWKGTIKPKIRLTGRWLERAGFKPDTHLHVRCIAPGILELRAIPQTVTVSEIASAGAEKY